MSPVKPVMESSSLPLFRVQQQKVCRIARISVLAVVRADQDIIIARIRACPIEAALLHIAPGLAFASSLLAGFFVSQRQADKARFLDLRVPEACVGVPVCDRDRAVG